MWKGVNVTLRGSQRTHRGGRGRTGAGRGKKRRECESWKLWTQLQPMRNTGSGGRPSGKSYIVKWYFRFDQWECPCKTKRRLTRSHDGNIQSSSSGGEEHWTRLVAGTLRVPTSEGKRERGVAFRGDSARA